MIMYYEHGKRALSPGIFSPGTKGGVSVVSVGWTILQDLFLIISYIYYYNNFIYFFIYYTIQETYFKIQLD